MRQEIAYAFVVLMLIASLAVWWSRVRKARRRRKHHLRVDLLKKNKPQ